MSWRRTACSCLFCFNEVACGRHGEVSSRAVPGRDRGRTAACRSRGPATRSVVVAGSGKKTDVKKQGLSSVQNEVVKANLMGISRKMKDKNWVDSQGRKGKVRAGPAARTHLARRAILLRGLCRGRGVPILPAVAQGYGVYRYADKYGANVDGYSPIYTPDTWSETGATYNLGLKGLIAWRAPQSPPADEGQFFQRCNVCKQLAAEQLLSTVQLVYWFTDLHNCIFCVDWKSHMFGHSTHVWKSHSSVVE